MLIVRNSPSAVETLGCALAGRFRTPPVFLCIGSDRVTGDCLGPLCGHLLKRRFNTPAFVYGGLDCPVNAINVRDVARFVTERHAGSTLCVIDASVGDSREVGCIRLIDGPVRPGSADGKELGEVGDVSITATVAARKSDLGGVRLQLVYALAETISSAVHHALSYSPSIIASVY